jgi:hypothetical protein
VIPAPWVGLGLSLDADLYVALPAHPARPALAAAMARAAARGLSDLGVVAPVPPDPDALDAYVESVRTADSLTRTRIHCGLELRLLATGTDLPATVAPRLSHVDFIRLVPELTAYLTRTALAVAAALPVPVVLAGPFAADADLTALGRACADAGVAIEVTERRHSPSVAAALALHAAGATLVPGSGARTAADVGRYDHVRRVAAALAPGPHPG